MAIENIGDNPAITKNPAHGLTVRTYDGVTLRILRHDHYAPRGRAEYSEEKAEILVIVRDSWRSLVAVDITIVYDARDFPIGEMLEVRTTLERRLQTRVNDQVDPRNPHKRNLTLTLWKESYDPPRVDMLLHLLDVTVPMTCAIRNNRAWRSQPRRTSAWADAIDPWAAK